MARTAPRRCLFFACVTLVHTLGLYADASGIDYRMTYPDTCPMGVDVLGRPSRLCLPNASGAKAWAPTYNMSMSTVIMPCNTSGYFDPVVAGRYGLVDIDWRNGKNVWANGHPMDSEAMLVAQARLIKSANPATRVWVYRNLVKALPWFSSVREKLCDPAYAGWFLKFDPAVTTPHVPRCDTNYNPPKCTEFYHDQEQTPQHPRGDGSCVEACDCGCVPCGEYLWDHRNASLRAWLAGVHATGATSLGDPHVDGIFTDDEWDVPSGPTEEDRHAVADMGLSPQDVADLRAGWILSMKAAQQAALDKGGFAWRLFSPGSSTGGSDPVGGPTGCTAFLRARCVANDTLQHSAMMMNAGKAPADFLPNLASFLLVRGPYAWFGNAWVGCNNVPQRRPEVDRDYGMPSGHCTETHPGSGVFRREYTRASVQVDCNAWTGTITPKKGRW